ncbi:hypothetical protein [Thermonema rossianum]|uniref:hypothetical protein n=1 Tax=Thermonema rossianum TaxID=55505 RepID=UPI00056FCBD0|nr:hypothetical protein [Thermonema rossianum]
MLFRIVFIISLHFYPILTYGQYVVSTSGESTQRLQVRYEVKNRVFEGYDTRFEGTLCLNGGKDTLCYQELLMYDDKKRVFYHVQKNGEDVKEYKLSLGTSTFAKKEKKKRKKRKKEEEDESGTLDSLVIIENASDLLLDWDKSKAESKVIQGYVCYKDTARKDGKALYEVWYCPDLPAGGPWILWHPEGLVLEARTLDQSLILEAKEVQYTEEVRFLPLGQWEGVQPMNRSEYIKWGEEFGAFMKEQIVQQVKPYLKLMSVSNIRGMANGSMFGLLRDPGVQAIVKKALDDAIEELIRLKQKQ